MHWDAPVYATEAQRRADKVDGHSSAREVSHALPRERALAEVVGDDPRPLLVMRECGFCAGTDDALLSTRLDNERTILLARWFHLVKLPNHVLSDDHPFRNLFEGDQPPHVFLCSVDGTDVVGFDGQQSQSDLWSAMEGVLAKAYERDAGRAVEKSIKLLDQLDRIDDELLRLRGEAEAALEEYGPTNGRSKAAAKKLAAAERERSDVKADLDEISDLKLRARAR